MGGEMNYCIVDNDVIVNIVEASTDYAASQGWISNQGWGIGWVRSGDTFVLPVAPVPDLAALKVAKNDEINVARLAANRSTFTHAGKQFACDELSRSDVDGTNGFVALYGALPPGWVGGWKAVDNSFYAIADVAGWKAFYTSMFAAGSLNFAHAQALKAMLAEAATAGEVAAIHWGMEIPETEGA